MSNFEKVFDALRNCITEPKCRDCPWESCEEFHQTKELPLDLCLDILNLLKEQNRTGKWTTKRTQMHDGEWYCDQCDYEPTVFEGSNYCPNCGAKMEMGR